MGGTNNQDSSRNYKIQYLRALAIIAVVLIHTCPMGLWQVVCRPFLNFAVALFLFLSGFLTSPPDGSWLQLYKKRISRVFVPYIIWSIIYTLPSSNAFSYIYNLITTNSSGTLYYIFVYIQLTLLAPLLIRLSKSSIWWIGIFITPIAFMLDCRYLEWWTDYEGIHKYLKLLRGISCFTWISYYYLGILIQNRPFTVSCKTGILFLALIGSLLIQTAEGYAMHLNGIVNCGTQAKISAWLTNLIFMMIACTFITKWDFTAKSKIMELLGKYSFGIYLIHVPIIRIIGYQTFISFPTGIRSIVVLVLSLLLTILLSTLCGKKITRYLGLS